MSHTATVEVEIKDRTAFVKACTRLGVEFSLNDTVTLYDGSEITGMTVRLKGWSYPVVFKDGKAHYDNYEGAWGEQSELDKFRQVYATEAAKRKARLQGFRVSERTLKDGTIRLVCQK
ncbi:MAG: hypothetical protein IH987_13535 [Planctomycetes bacterium]|nr:hypothetical protein [Planctomycetota bacterium]